MYSIERFASGDKGMELFEAFPEQLYEEDSFYKPEPVEKDIRSLYFLVRSGERVVARGALLFNKELLYNYKPVALIGYYESEDDSRATLMLFQELEQVAIARGASYIIGPMNGTIWHKYRCVNSDFTQPFFGEIYHKPYYYKHFQSHHYEPIQTYHSTTTKLVDSPHVSKQIAFYEQHFKEEGVTIRQIRKSSFKEDLERIYSVATRAFTDSFFYTPLPQEDFLDIYLPLKDSIDTRFVMIAENSSGEIVGYIISFPDWYDKTTNRAIVIKEVAVLDEHDYRGLEPLLIEEVHKLALTMGCHTAIQAHMAKDTAANMILSPHTHILREYVLYGKKIEKEE